MPTERQIITMTEPHGFRLEHKPGFVAVARRHPEDARHQWFKIFWWGNPKHADAKGIPRSYLCIDPILDSEQGHSTLGRYRLPLVDWPDNPDDRLPSSEQKIRPWRDVVKEFNEVFVAALDAPQEIGHANLLALGERYRLG